MAKIKLTAKQKKMIIGIVAGVLLVVAGIVALVKMNSVNNGNNDVPATAEEVQIEAAGFFSKGDVDGGFSYYDERIENEQDTSDKQSLLIQKSSYALIAERYDVAIDAAKQAESINSNAKTVRALAEAYMASGDKEQALIYYKKLLDISPDDDSGLQRGPSVEAMIKELEREI